MYCVGSYYIAYHMNTQVLHLRCTDKLVVFKVLGIIHCKTYITS